MSVPVGVAFASQIQDDDGLVMRRVNQSHFKVQRWIELIKSHRHSMGGLCHERQRTP